MDTQACPTYHRTSPLPKTHTLLCASLHPPRLPPKPASGQHILGLHFPPSSHTPEPTWIPLSTSTDEETSITFQSVDVSCIFPRAIQPEVLYTDRNRVWDRDTKSMLEIWMLPPSHMSSEPPNTCIVDLLKIPDSRGRRRRGGEEWRGPVLALAMTRATGFMVDPGAYKDISVRDAEDVADFLGSYGEDVRGEGFWDGVGGPGTEAAMDVGKEEKVNDENEMEGRSTTGKAEDGLKVKCSCGTTADDGSNMIHCAGCDTWQHMECYYPGQGKKMRFDHLCRGCEASKTARGTEQEVKQEENKEQIFEVM